MIVLTLRVIDIENSTNITVIKNRLSEPQSKFIGYYKKKECSLSMFMDLVGRIKTQAYTKK